MSLSFEHSRRTRVLPQIFDGLGEVGSVKRFRRDRSIWNQVANAF